MTDLDKADVQITNDQQEQAAASVEPEKGNPEAATVETDQRNRLPPAKQGKLIIRNLGFDLREKHLLAAFKKFGKIVDCSVPLNQNNNQNRGFGFVEFLEKDCATNAVKEMHAAKFKGRPLTVEFSVPKEAYQKRVDQIVEHTNMSQKEVLRPISVRIEQKEKAVLNQKKADERAESKKVEEAKKAEEDAQKTKTQLRKEQRAEKEQNKAKMEERQQRKQQETDNANQATLFVRNIGWDTTQDDFKEFMEQFGNVKYAVLCRASGDASAEGQNQTQQQ